MWRSVAVGAVLAGILAGCSLGGGSAAPTEVPVGHLRGQLFTEGGTMIGGSGSDLRPVRHAWVWVFTPQGKLVRSVSTGRVGAFRADLPPGRYTVKNSAYPHVIERVVVASGKVTPLFIKVHLI